MSDTVWHFQREFDRLEHVTPEQRADLFFHMEKRWCWDCGRDQSEDHPDCASQVESSATYVPPGERQAAALERIAAAVEHLAQAHPNRRAEP